MAGDFTRTVEYARDLLRLYQAEGRAALLEALRLQAEIVADDARGDTRDIDRRFTAVAFGILSVLYVHDSERLMRRQMAVTENFLHETDPTRKVDVLIADLDRFFEEYEAERRELAFSARIRLLLSTCGLDVLKKTTVTTLADQFGYHPNYLSNKFKKEQGITLQEAILEEKLNRGLLLLKDAAVRITIKELSWELGFADAAYFSQVFKKRFGFLPNEVQPH